MSYNWKNRRDRGIFRDSTKEYYIPSCIFNTKLSSFATIVKFLKEGHGIGFQQIASKLGKKKQSVWRTYKNASKVRVHVT